MTAQSGDEDMSVSLAKGSGLPQALAPSPPRPQPSHLGVDDGIIETEGARSEKQAVRLLARTGQTLVPSDTTLVPNIDACASQPSDIFDL